MQRAQQCKITTARLGLGAKAGGRCGVGQGAGPNPIWVRELRSRWRRPLTHLIVLSYSAILGWLAWQLYATYAVTASSGDPSLIESTLVPGHRLFIASTWAQALLWTCVAPLLSSSAISGERERGMMTELELAGLSHRQILRGKLLSSLSFLAVLLLVPLPITALCFQMGGVAPGELALSVLLQAALAGAGVSLGVLCSAWNRKTVTACGVALLLAVPGCALILQSHRALENNFVAVALSLTALCLILACCLFEAAVQAMQTWTHWDAMLAPVYDTSNIMHSTFTSAAPVMIGRDFVPPLGAETKAQATSPLQSTLSGPRPHRPPPHMLREAERHEERTAWVQRLVARNPICQRELRTRFRESQLSDWQGAPVDWYGRSSLKPWAIAGLVALLGGRWLPFGLWHGCMIFSLLGESLFCAITAATAFTREREQQMLGMLLLTRLSPLDIVAGKIGVPLALSAHWFAYPITILSLWALSYGLSIGLASVALFTGFALCASALGLWFSWVCRHTTIAAAGAVAGFAAVVGSPAALVFLLDTPWAELLRTWWVKPVWDTLLFLPQALVVPPHMAWMVPPQTRLFSEFLGASLELSLVLMALSGLLLAHVMWALRPGTIEKEGRSILNLDLTQSLN